MINGFYTASTGLFTMQTAMDITSNNIANISTDGYKALRASFKDLLYTDLDKDENKGDEGHGVALSKTDLMTNQGALRKTDSLLDFAIVSEHFFALKDNDGNVSYTRNGAFRETNKNGENYLTDTLGTNVLDAEGNPIKIIKGEDGTTDIENIKNSIGLYRFENPYGLKAGGSNTYTATASSGEGISDKENGEIVESALESSSADLAKEMVKVLQYQKGFSLNAKMLQAADDIENLVNNLR